MVFQIAATVALPVIMLIVAVSPFDEPINVEPSEPKTPENIESVYFTFFTLWLIWILILTRIIYQIKKGSFRARNAF